MRIHLPVFQTFVQIFNEHNSFKAVYMIYCYNDKSFTSSYEPGHYGYKRVDGQYHGSRDIQRFIKRRPIKETPKKDKEQ